MKAADVTSLLQEAFKVRAIQNAGRADQSIRSVTGVVRSHWLRIVEIASKGGSRQAVKAAVQSELTKMVAATEVAMEDALVDGAITGWDSAFDVWADVLPAEWWKHAFPDDPEINLLESVEFDFDEPFPSPGAKSKTGAKPIKFKGVPKAKAVTASAKKPSLSKGTKVSKVTAAKVKAAKRPSRAGLRATVRSRGWKSRMRKWSKKITDTDKVAELIADGVEKGWKLETIIKRVKPFVQNYAASARRIVRTEVARLQNEQLEKTFDLFGDIIAGYQIINPLDERTRPEHAIRAGRIYWKDERKKYKASERPSLPDEANCRCSYAPILKDIAPKELADGPRADTRTYAGWFNNQPDSVKEKVVGKARWDVLKKKGGRASWYDAVDPKTGRLMDVNKLKKESPRSTAARRKSLKKAAETNKKAAAKSLKKYVPPNQK